MRREREREGEREISVIKRENRERERFQKIGEEWDITRVKENKR